MDSASYANYQIPVNPDLQSVSTQGNGNPWVGGSFSPSNLNDNQNEQNYYGVLAYQKSTGNLDYQAAVFGRESSAHYVPGDIPAALYYNGGVATDEDRILDSGGFQADGTYRMNDDHTLRGGIMSMEESVDATTNTTVFPVDASGNINGSAKTIGQSNSPSAFFYGMYLQDEWKFAPEWTLNYGGRFDLYSSSFDNEWQFSPRLNLVYQPSSKTTWHIGYARYFTPPPLETVPGSNITAFNGTSGASSVTQDDPVKAERSNYFDLGVTQKIAEGFQLGIDAYYKRAQNQLDDGLFGQSLILSSFNYSEGRVGGVELSVSYDHGGFNSYANVAYSVAQGKGASSAQFLWGDQGTLDYVNSHWIYLDHDQRVTASTGASYTWGNPKKEFTRTGIDLIVGSGLRENSTDTIGGSIDPTDPIPNGESVPAYYTLNVFAERRFRLPNGNFLKARLDVVNLTDNVYELRSGSGVGVNAAQYGARRGFFGTLAYSF
jgi:outer membrane receptor protein involved in Fe transport